MTNGQTPNDAVQAPPKGGRDIKRIVAWIVVVLAAVWLVAFIVSNSETVKVSFVFGDVSLELIWVMIICAVLGAGLALALPALLRRRAKKEP